MNIFIRAYFGEFLANFLLGVGLFSLFFFFGQSSQLLELALLVAGGDAAIFFGSLVKLYGRYWLSVSGFILPMGAFFGNVLTLSRLQQDRELLAFETLGINIHNWLRVIVLLGSLVFLVLQFRIVGRDMPKARFSLKHFAYQSKNLIQNFRPQAGVWLDLGSAKLLAQKTEANYLEGVTLYMGKNSLKEENTPLYRVLGSLAKYEIISEDAQHANLHLQFSSGSLEIPSREKPSETTRCEFETYETFIPLSYPASLVRSWREHTNRELRKILREPQRYQVSQEEKQSIELEYQYRLSLILSALALAIVSVYACQRFHRLTRGFSFGLALALLIVYWIVMVLATSLKLPWLTDIAYLAITLPALRLLR